MNAIHIVCGPPASGKTTYGRKLAEGLDGVLLDSDAVCDRLIESGLALANLSPNDRDSSAYKAAYRDSVYQTLFDLCLEIVRACPVVIAGPFTSESQTHDWPQTLEKRLNVSPEIHFLMVPAERRKAQMKQRGAARDQSKLADWARHCTASFDGPPPFPCHLVESSSL